MRFINFVIIRLAAYVLSGILLGYYLECEIHPILPIGLLTALFYCWHRERRKIRKSLIFELLTALLFICLGWMNYLGRTAEAQSGHYIHQLHDGNHLLHLKIGREIKPDNYYLKYHANVLAIDSVPVSGKVLLRIRKDNLTSEVQTDDLVSAVAELRKINVPLNPGQFDYSSYMKFQGIIHQADLYDSSVIDIAAGSRSLLGLAFQFRQFLVSRLNESGIGTTERLLVKALVLGDKQDLSRELYQDYADAGAVHMLAVSGLHVGIIYLIISFLLRPLNYFKRGERIRFIILALFLWIYAMLTGLSPSVTRAVAMFSCFALARVINRPTYALNTCFISVFFLLLINPLWLFHLGFQLSYLAVFSIIILQPRLASVYRPKFFIDKMIWDIFTVSFIAQLGVTPLCIYYFNQFPGLFMLSNFTLLPWLGIAVGGGILLLILLCLGIHIPYYELYYGRGLGYMNQFVGWVADQDAFLFKNISFNMLQVCCAYLGIVMAVAFFRTTLSGRIRIILATAILILVSDVHTSRLINKTEIIIFHRNRKTIIGYRHSENLILYSSDSQESLASSYPVRGYVIRSHIDNISVAQIKNSYEFRNLRLTVIDSSGVYLPLIISDVLLLSGSPRINLDRVIDELSPRTIVADGSNYNSYIRRWERTAIKRKLPFHHTGTKGAFEQE